MTKDIPAIKQRTKELAKLINLVRKKAKSDLKDDVTARFYMDLIRDLLKQGDDTLEKLYFSTSLFVNALVSEVFPSLYLTDTDLEHIEICAGFLGEVFSNISEKPEKILDGLTAYDAMMKSLNSVLTGKLSSTSLSSAVRTAPPEIAPDRPEECVNAIPSKIIAHTNEYVVSQEEAKKTISIYLSNHFNLAFSSPTLAATHPCLLLTGPSGTGKTYMVKTMAKFLGAPFIEVDITQFSTTGYKGRDLQEIIDDVHLTGLKHKSPIVFIDEVDKIFNQLDFVAGLQAGLLKLTDGDTFDNGVRPCIIFGGSFSFLKDREGHGKRTVGFQGQPTASGSDYLTHDHLIKFGMLPELVGRIGNIVSTKPLTRDSLYALLKTKNGIKEYYDALFSAHGISDNVSDDDLYSIIDKAAIDISKIGARGLKIVAEQHFRDRLFY